MSDVAFDELLIKILEETGPINSKKRVKIQSSFKN
ncbi:hypothetical protein UC3_02873 [Enterococcus phoeniculicola ATCC BAA-412]|uniref:Uncharacterized protein n=1 Tax=Enterococcus phoeniculicola ATCC BAA-412 TaxID=1158610 RepID=R3W4S7_9ENTE|nr:hypothetical protein UC3_02873 [Enterococcus phoeniculicola ATCC BAA-412]EOT79200.1 hypothetical protein I589_00708 [Enterococcus phoeniculicola ATCC BAA-412]